MNLIEYTHKDFTKYQQALLAQCLTLPSLYQSIQLQYYQHYFEQTFVDQSFCIELGKKPLLLVLISDSSAEKLSYYSLPIKLVWLERISDKEQKGALKSAIKYLTKLQNEKNKNIYYQDDAVGFLPEFSVALLKQGYSAKNFYNQKIDLSLPEDQLFSDLRKIYRANVRWGQSQLIYKTLEKSNCMLGDIEPFRQLHMQVSGRETRNQASWLAQEKMIIAGQAFAIYGYLDNVLVAAGFFIYNHYECYYGVGAYQRELFDKPISHASVWQAIVQAKKLDCRYFTLGEAIFTAGSNLPGEKQVTNKEQSISHFKQGFGGNYYPVTLFEK